MLYGKYYSVTETQEQGVFKLCVEGSHFMKEKPGKETPETNVTYFTILLRRSCTCKTKR